MKDIIDNMVELWLESGKTSEDFLYESYIIHNRLYFLETLREGRLEAK